MSRFNEKQIPYAEQDRLVMMLSEVLEKLKKRKRIFNFLKDLLNRQERLMTVRRLLIAEMLVDGKTYEQIQKKLKTGASTIARVERWLHFGRNGILTAVLIKKKFSRGHSHTQEYGSGG